MSSALSDTGSTDVVDCGLRFGMGCFAVVLAAAANADHPFFDRLSIPQQVHRVQLDRSRMVTMRDGKRLSTDVYLPVGVEGPLPVILIRTPYDKKPYRASLATQRAWRASPGRPS